MPNNINFSDDARAQLMKGVDKLANAVVATLGPSGRNVLIQQPQGNPISTKDGVTVAKSIELLDPIENIGAQLVKQASTKTADKAGDGTTTSTLLAREIYKEGIRIMEGTNAIEVKRGIDKATIFVVDYLEKYSKDVTDESQLKQIATISANNDEEIGELISSAINKVGVDGVVTVEESRTEETYLETVEGIQFDRGFKSPYFVTDNSTMQAVLREPLILITDARLMQVKELLPVLEACSSQNKSLLIIADDIDGEALSTLVVNKMRGTLSCVAVKAPQFGDRKKAMLEDIAVLTGGQVVSKEKGMRLDKFNMEWFGKSKKVTVSKEFTTIIDAHGEEEAIKSRIEEIKAQINESRSNYEKEVLQDRLSKFVGGVAIVYTGGLSDLEIKEKKDRVEDALHATKAAIEEGILPGGGVALLNAAFQLGKSITTKEFLSEFPDQRLGANIIRKAATMPFIQILLNAGETEDKIAERITHIAVDQEDKWLGFNPRTGEYVNMFDKGIIDPTKVTRLALENAASVAGTMLTTEAIVSIIEVEGKPKMADIDPAMLLG